MTRDPGGKQTGPYDDGSQPRHQLHDAYPQSSGTAPYVFGHHVEGVFPDIRERRVKNIVAREAQVAARPSVALLLMQ